MDLKELTPEERAIKLKELEQNLNEKTIKAMSKNDLLAFLVESMMLIPAFNFKTVQLSKERQKEAVLEFDEVAKEIKMDVENQEFTYPVYDEREKEVFKQKVFGDFYDRIPAKGNFKYLAALHLQRLFGIVEVTVNVGTVTKKDADWRHPHFDVKTVIEDYLYDFETDKYSIVAKSEKKKPKTPQQQELTRRKELLKIALNQLSDVEEEYLDNFDKLYFNFRNKETMSKKEFLNYFKDFRTHIKELKDRIAYKMVFSNISLLEYTKITEHMGKIITDIDAKIVNIKEFEKDHNLGSSDFSFKGITAIDAEYAVYTDWKEFKERIIKFITARSESGSAESPKTGYFLIDEEHLYPNVAEIERRLYFTAGMMNMDKELKIQQEMKRWYEIKTKKEKNKNQEEIIVEQKEEQPVQDDGFIFTLEEIERMKKMQPQERVKFALHHDKFLKLDNDERTTRMDELKLGTFRQ
ncbi:hypothetical protein [Priestia megaterium]|uniref:hypothetical protein n=1 Tax=Priestia megaterium TaxID=1404 RepID=UPI0034D699B2